MHNGDHGESQPCICRRFESGCVNGPLVSGECRQVREPTGGCHGFQLEMAAVRSPTAEIQRYPQQANHSHPTASAPPQKTVLPLSRYLPAPNKYPRAGSPSPIALKQIRGFRGGRWAVPI